MLWGMEVYQLFGSEPLIIKHLYGKPHIFSGFPYQKQFSSARIKNLRVMYPPQNSHIPPKGKFGNSSTQNCLGEGYVGSQEGIYILRIDGPGAPETIQPRHLGTIQLKDPWGYSG